LTEKATEMDQSEEIFRLVREWRKSGLSQSEFCKTYSVKAAKIGCIGVFLDELMMTTLTLEGSLVKVYLSAFHRSGAPVSLSSRRQV